MAPPWNRISLVGSTGFVGGTLLRQAAFDDCYHSANIHEICGRDFDTIVCAGAPAQKWLANRDPEGDRRNIDALIGHLETVNCRQFILISTVDVFASPVGVDEDRPVDDDGLEAYGLNRLHLENWAAGRFPRHLVVRLPGVVGPGLRKNIVYDLLHGNRLDLIDSRGRFQFYPMVNLWRDIGIANALRLSLVHLTAEPVTVVDVAAEGFGLRHDHVLAAPPPEYDFRTRHAAAFGSAGSYQYSRRESLLAIRAYAQSGGSVRAIDGRPA